MRIKEVRLEHGYTQNDLAKMLGIDFSTLSKYENGKLEVPIKRLREIAQCLDVSVTDLLDEASEGEQPIRSVIRRKSEYIAEVFQRANGVCELCGQLGPFLDKDGHPYLELHHIVPMKRCVKLDASNTVALCPNCIAKMRILCLPEDYKRLKNIAGKSERSTK